MFGENKGEKEIAVAYAPKFWEAGNAVVTLMFGLAFAVYVVLVQYAEVRYLVSIYFKYLVALAVLGNASLGFVLWRLYVHEKRLVKLVTDDVTIVGAIRSSFKIRVGLFLFNTIMYFVIIIFVWSIKPPNPSPQVAVPVTTPIK